MPGKYVNQVSKKFQQVHYYKNVIEDRRSYDKFMKTAIIPGKVFNYLWK